MDAVAQVVLEYVTSEGNNTFHDWLHRLRDIQARARVRVRVNRLRLGNFGDVKPVGGGVSELRVPYGPGYRVYFGSLDGTVVLLLCGGDKSTQVQDIRMAKAYWTDYQRRLS
jgi:putative addiction module killer protein